MSCNRRHSGHENNNNDNNSNSLDPFANEMTCGGCPCSSSCFCEPKMTIYHGSSCSGFLEDDDDCCECCCCCCCPIPRMDEFSICEQQMKYVLAQLISLYPGKTFVFNIEGNAAAVTGVPTALVSPINKGLLRVNTGAATVYVNVCSIASFRIIDAEYNPALRYLPASPDAPVEGSESSLRSILRVGVVATIAAGTAALPTGTVVASEFGVAAIKVGDDLVFVSARSVKTVAIVTAP